MANNTFLTNLRNFLKRTKLPQRILLLFILISMGILGSSPLSSSTASAQGSTEWSVRVFVDRIQAIEGCWDRVIFVGCGDPDFYPEVRLNGQGSKFKNLEIEDKRFVDLIKRRRDQNPIIYPLSYSIGEWIFSGRFTITEPSTSVGVYIGLYDADHATDPTGDTEVDINLREDIECPGGTFCNPPIHRALQMRFYPDRYCQLFEGPWGNLIARGDRDRDSCIINMFSYGRDDDNAMIWFRIEATRIADRTQSAETFENPRIFGRSLDWCTYWGNWCGGHAAMTFCQAKGYNRVAPGGYNIAYDIGEQSPTYVYGEGLICDQGFCDGFSRITCDRGAWSTADALTEPEMVSTTEALPTPIPTIPPYTDTLSIELYPRSTTGPLAEPSLYLPIILR